MNGKVSWFEVNVMVQPKITQQLTKMHSHMKQSSSTELFP